MRNCCALQCQLRREDVRVEDDIFSREANLFGGILYARRQISIFRARVSAWPVRQKPLPLLPHRSDATVSREDKGVDTLFHRDRVNNAFALVHFRPFSITSHFEESIIIGTERYPVHRQSD